ncbi:MAG: MipA/OmpV family protein [Lautropia sp.]|nr:MipA/OmpV family protein [Lautropia sp.]
MMYGSHLIPKPLSLSGRLLLAGLIFATAGPALSQGQLTPAQRATRAVTRADDDMRIPPAENNRVHLSLGLVVNTSPEYSGSDKMGTALAPAGRISWRGYSISRSSVSRASSSRSTSNPSETGFSGPMLSLNRFSAGIGLSIHRGRDVSEEDVAKGLKPLRGTLIGRLRLRYDLTESLQLQSRIVGDLLGRQEGIEIPLSLNWQRSLKPKLLLSASVGFTWADAESMRNTYEITEREHRAGGLPLYRPGSGIREYGASVGLTGEPSKRWVWVANASLVYLVGPAARSPMVKERWMPSISTGIAYRFTL